jgi:hypothetical protein
MRPRIDLRTLAGTIAVLTSLALLSPGVRAVCASDAAAHASAEGQGLVCSVDDASAPPSAAPAEQPPGAQGHRRERWVQVAGPEQVIPLNTRGYNNEPPRRPAPPAAPMRRP